MRKRTPESVIQRGILDYLTMVSKDVPIYFFRAGSGAMKTEHGRYFKTGKPGCPDIIVCYHPPENGLYLGTGDFIGLEVKTATGRQSAAQKKAEQEIKQAGGRYYIVRSIADVKKIIPAPGLSDQSTEQGL